jgi:hypothetical protein
VKHGFVLAISDHSLHFVGAHSKIDPLLDEMLRNYPKVDMGKAEKVGGGVYVDAFSSRSKEK